MLTFERQAWTSGYGRVAGVDEVGRGPLAGPVVAAAVVLTRSYLEAQADCTLDGLTDSKRLSESRREMFCSLITECDEAAVGVGSASPEEIDQINILNATHAAMKRAIDALPSLPDYVLVDGLPVSGLPCESKAVVKGDSKSLLIAAASVVAKVTRDRQMCEYDTKYPGYGFAAHKGYGTKVHMRALFKMGPCPIHRKSFQPVADAMAIKLRKPRLGQQELGL